MTEQTGPPIATIQEHSGSICYTLHSSNLRLSSDSSLQYRGEPISYGLSPYHHCYRAPAFDWAAILHACTHVPGYLSVYQPSLPIDPVVWSPGLIVKLLDLVLAPLLAIELSTQAA